MVDKTMESIVDKILQDRTKCAEQEAIVIENAKEYAKALNGVACTPNGKLVLRTLIKAGGVFTPSSPVDVSTLIRNNERRNVYLQFIRPYLDPDVKQALEYEPAIKKE